MISSSQTPLSTKHNAKHKQTQQKNIRTHSEIPNCDLYNRETAENLPCGLVNMSNVLPYLFWRGYSSILQCHLLISLQIVGRVLCKHCNSLATYSIHFAINSKFRIRCQYMKQRLLYYYCYGLKQLTWYLTTHSKTGLNAPLYFNNMHRLFHWVM